MFTVVEGLEGSCIAAHSDEDARLVGVYWRISAYCIEDAQLVGVCWRMFAQY